MTLERRIASSVAEDLSRKMVFVSGPRQCGKSTLAKDLLATQGGRYYTWDLESDRRLLKASRLDSNAPLWVFDELHKYRLWRNWLKGVYDTRAPHQKILVTGSARLEVYSFGGDSLQGRYHPYRLHPLTLSELLHLPALDNASDLVTCGAVPPAGTAEALDQLLRLGGFPEPLLSGSERQASRWRLGYGQRLVREDIRDLENLRDLDRVELLHDRLPDTVGSVLSINNLREDIEVAFETVRKWISVFEAMYSVFRLPPFGAPRIKAVRKEQKLYLWDWSRVATAPARLENLVAMHLLRLCHWCADVEGQKVELRYYRDVTGREVDFIVLRDRRPWFAVEVKSSQSGLDGNLKYLLERVRFPHAFQLHLEGNDDWRPPPINGCQVRLLPVSRFLCQLP